MTKKLLMRATLYKTMNEVNQCNICQKIFTTKKGVGKHIRLVHKKKRPITVTYVQSRLEGRNI